MRYLEWHWDPDPDDSWTQTEYVFVLRGADGAVEVVHEAHRHGLFGRDVWLRLLADAGFEPTAVTEETIGGPNASRAVRRAPPCLVQSARPSAASAGSQPSRWRPGTSRRRSCPTSG